MNNLGMLAKIKIPIIIDFLKNSTILLKTKIFIRIL